MSEKLRSRCARSFPAVSLTGGYLSSSPTVSERKKTQMANAAKDLI
jgi:hypothetical protein